MYVDNLIIIESNTGTILKFKQAMEMIEGYYNHRIGIYEKVLKDAGMFDCNPTLIPMDSNVKFSKGEGEEGVDATKYRSLVARLRYLLQTRLDLLYEFSITS